MKEELVGGLFAPEITIRAGGEMGRTAAMVPCCQTLGPPNEEKSILGHLDKETFEDVYFGNKYNDLRKAHSEKILILNIVKIVIFYMKIQRLWFGQMIKMQNYIICLVQMMILYSTFNYKS